MQEQSRRCGDVGKGWFEVALSIYGRPQTGFVTASGCEIPQGCGCYTLPERFRLFSNVAPGGSWFHAVSPRVPGLPRKLVGWNNAGSLAIRPGAQGVRKAGCL